MKNELRELQIAISYAETIAQQIVEKREDIFTETKDDKFRLSEEGEEYEEQTIQISEIFDEIQNLWNELEELIEEQNEK